MQLPEQMVPELELCLDFTDTVDWRTSNHADDKLTSYKELLGWSLEKGIITRSVERKLSSLGESSLGRKVLAEAFQLREAIYGVFSAIAHSRKADEKDLEVINAYLGRSLGKLAVRTVGDQFAWGWSDLESADSMLWPIARSAAELLTSEELDRVRECANEEEGCGSLFLDCSKRQNKKWCSMDSCGNRAKQRAYYERHRQDPSS